MSNVWSKLINLTKNVSGVLPIANGGTNKALTLAAGGVVWTDADSFEVSAAGTSGHVLVSAGTSAPAYALIVDANVSGSAAITGSKIATAGALGTTTGVVTTFVPTIKSSVKSVTAGNSYTVLDNDGFDVVLVATGTSSNSTITLPTAADNAGRRLLVKKTDTASSTKTVIIDGEGAETIDGAATLTLLNQYDEAVIVCDGTAWYRFSAPKAGIWTTYTPTIGNLGGGDPTGYTVGAFYRLVGDSLEVMFQFAKSGTAGAGTTAVTITLPTSPISLTIDSTKLPSTTTDKSSFGSVYTNSSTQAKTVVSVTYTATVNTTVKLHTVLDNSDFSGQNVDANMQVYGRFTVPCSELSGTVGPN